MSEIQKIAIGLLGMSHPEIYRARARNASAEAAMRTDEASTLKSKYAPGPTQGSKPTRAAPSIARTEICVRRAGRRRSRDSARRQQPAYARTRRVWSATKGLLIWALDGDQVAGLPWRTPHLESPT